MLLDEGIGNSHRFRETDVSNVERCVPQAQVEVKKINQDRVFKAGVASKVDRSSDYSCPVAGQADWNNCRKI